MTVARFPSLAHWGAFTAVVEDGRLVGCEPFRRDPAPSRHARRHAGDGAFAVAHRAPGDPRRLARRAGRAPARDSFHEVSWDEALDTVAAELTRVREHLRRDAIFGGSYGWSSAGRVHHARTPAAALPVPGRRLRRPGRQLQLRRRAFPAAASDRHASRRSPAEITDWPSVVKHTRLMIAFGGLAAEERPGHLRRRRRAQPGDLAAPRQRRRRRVRLGQPAALRRAGFPRRAVDPDPPQYRYRADAGDGAHAASTKAATTRSSWRAIASGLRAVPALPAWRPTTALPKTPTGRPRSPAFAADTIRDLARRAAGPAA